MSRRWLILLLIPALALVAWVLAEQLPRWLAPQPNWFAPQTPAVCAAVDSLRLYQAQRAESSGIGSAAASTAAEQIIAQHYGSSSHTLGEPLAVQATLPNSPRSVYYVITAQLPEAAAVIFIDALSGEPSALITAPLTETVACDFDARAALASAVRSPPVLILVAYVLLTAGALVAWRLLRSKGKSS